METRMVSDEMTENNSSFSSHFIRFVPLKGNLGVHSTVFSPSLSWRTSFIRHLLRTHHPSVYTLSYLFQPPVFSLLATLFIASAFSHETPSSPLPFALIKTCVDVWRPRDDGWSSPGELESWTEPTSSGGKKGGEREWKSRGGRDL